jgi:NitT/TauT family transport system substrate-binding protein
MHREIVQRYAFLRRAVRLLLVLLVLLLAGGCDALNSKPKPLRLGLSDWPGHAPFYGAAKLGHFGPAQVEIKGFSSNFDRNRAFAQGKLDVLATPLFDALRIADDGVPLKIILLFDYSSGGDGIVARQEIAAVRDLKGKRVSAELSAITHFVLLAALTQAGLSEADVQIVNLSVPEAADAFAHGKLDAATLWDPHLSRQAGAPGAHKIFTSKEIPGQVIDVLIVHKAVAEARPEDVASVVRGWEQTLKAWKARPAELEAVMAKETNRTPEELRADFSGMELLDLARNSELFSADAPGQSVWKAYEMSVRFMAQHQLLKQAAPDPKEILEPRFIERARAK